MKQCPGSSAFAQPKLEIVECPDCGGDVEVWSDEADGLCPACKKPVVRRNTQACMDWCRYAVQCLGEVKYKQYRTMKTQMRKQALVQAMQDYLGKDEPRKARALRTMAFAEEILCEERDADPNVVMAAAVLGDLTCPCTQAATGSGPAAAADAAGPVATILEKLEYPNGFVKAVCTIVGRPQPGPEEKDLNFRIVHDARLLAFSSDTAVASVPSGLLTAAGRRLGERKKGTEQCHAS